MDLKTKGKEGTNAKGQKKENANLVKVNKQPVNDGKSPGKEKKDDADDISNNFPNFGALNEEEKLAFFEALSAARKNIEKRGLPTRERFGTVHDEYLQYFARDDKEETVQKKPESAPSASRSPVPSRISPKESKPTASDWPRQRAPRPPKPASPPKKAPKSPQKNPRPESEPNDLCEAVIKRDTDQMIQIYLDKKKRIEEQWKKDAQATKSPPPVPRPKNRERNRPPSGRPPSRKEDPKPKTPSQPLASSNTPHFQAFNPNDRKDFFKLLKEAHTNILFKNPQQKNDGLALDEVLKPYKGAAKATTACPATQLLQTGKQHQKNLRVKVTLASADNKRLSRTKSQVLNDSTKEGSGGKSKSLESLACPDVPDGKQSKIPILRKAPQERNDDSDIKTETQPVKKAACEDSVAPRATKKAEAAEVKRAEAAEVKRAEAAEARREEARRAEAAEARREEARREEARREEARRAEARREEARREEARREEARREEARREEARREEARREEARREEARREEARRAEARREEARRAEARREEARRAEARREEARRAEAAEAKKTEAPIKEKALTIKEEPEEKEEIQITAKEKKTDQNRDIKEEEMFEECGCEDAAENLAETKEELKKVRKEKQKTLREKEKAVKEKEKALAEAIKKEKELLRKKKKQEWRKSHQKKEKKAREADCLGLKVVGVRIRPETLLEEEKKQHTEEKKKSACQKEELAKKTSQEKGAEYKEQEQPSKQSSQEKGAECKEQEQPSKQSSQEKGAEYKEQEQPRKQTSQEKGAECKEQEQPRKQTSQEKGVEYREQELLIVQTSIENGVESEEKMSGGEGYQKGDCLKKEQEEEEEEDKGEKSEGRSSSEEVERPRQHSAKSQIVLEACQQQSAGDFSDASARKEASEHHGVFSSLACSEHIVKTATHSTKSLAGVSLLEKRPEETWQTQEMVPTYTTGKVVVVDDNVIKRIKDLIQYLDRKANAKDNLQSEYVRLVLSYTEYLTKVTESLILAKKPKKGQQVHSTYAAPEVHLKFDEGDGTPKGDQKKPRVPHSISEEELQMPQGPSGIEKKEDSRRKESRNDSDLLSDSGSSSHSEDENRTLTPSLFKQTGIPMTKIRLLQDLLNGRAKFEEGSFNDLKIVHMPEGEFVPPEKPPKEEAKEISDADGDQGQKAMGMKFLRNLVKLCNCGKKQIEEDAILENLKGEAVRVDTAEPQKDPASATINDSTMEVLKAAERKRIIEKYLKKEQS